MVRPQAENCLWLLVASFVTSSMALNLVPASELATAPAVFALVEFFGGQLALVVLASLFARVRVVLWGLLLVAGLGFLAFRPSEDGGMLLVLLATDALCQRGHRRRGTGVDFAAVALAVAAAQVTALYAAPQQWGELALRWAISDAAFAGLVWLRMVHSDAPSPVAPARRPVVNLSNLRLTQRELQIAHLVIGGQTSKEIAYFLNTSDGAIRVALSAIYKKLRVRNGTELQIMVHTHELVLDSADALSRC